MTLRVYFIKSKNITRAIYDWIAQQPGFVSFNFIRNDMEANIDHPTITDETNFTTELSNRLSGILVDNVPVNVAKYIDEIKTDQLFYTTETAVTKTNVGTTYVNVFSDFGGRPFFIDTTGFTSMAIQILWTKVGTGTQTLRIVEDSTTTQILESGSLVTGSNDFSNVTIPPGALNFKGKWRLQCKSTVAGDSPVFAGMRVYLRR